MRAISDNSKARTAFIARKNEIDAILPRLTELSSEHFGHQLDAVTWGDVGTLGTYLVGLREISDTAFHEGECAP